jgi:putative transposase
VTQTKQPPANTGRFTLLPDTAVERFNIGVIAGPSWAGEVQLDLVEVCPLVEWSADELWAVVDTDAPRFSPDTGNPVELFNDLDSEPQILAILRQAEGGVPVAELCREHGMSNASFYKWRSKYGGMDASMISQMKAIEDENRRLKKMFAELSMQNELLKEALGKK